jgi:L-ascorbate metabolism protein UlaG (beta-lactamase superfamily)
MKITRFEHSAFVLTQGEQELIVDPGGLTPLLPPLHAVSAVFVSHSHPDHLDIDQLNAIRQRNPRAPIYGTQQVADAAAAVAPKAVRAGERVSAGPFRLEFAGSTHAEILTIVPRIENVGVVVNGTLFYPGDSFSAPPGRVDTLVVPVAAPWLRIADLEEYVGLIKPRRIVPVHTAVLSESGQSLTGRLVAQIAANVGAELLDLRPGESHELG